MTITISTARLHLACAALAALVLHSCIPEPAYAATPLQLRWTAELSDPKPYNAVLFQGESADLVATLKLYGRAVAIEETAMASLYYQTNGMGSAWWQSPATVTTAGVVTASWTPDMDAGADLYRWHLGVANAASSTIYRAFGAFRMQPSPGAAPNILDLPTRWIDFDLVAISNAPWATPADVAEATTGVLRVELDPVASAALSQHAARQDNPHGVTADITGALAQSWAPTGTVYRAEIIGDDETWISATDGTGTLHTATATGFISVVSTSDAEEPGDYNGPPAGTVWDEISGTDEDGVVTYEAVDGWILQYDPREGYYPWLVMFESRWFYSEPGDSELPATLTGLSFGHGSLTLGSFWNSSSSPIVTEATLPWHGRAWATSNWVESIRGVHADIASNVVYHVVVSNGHWLIQEVE